MNWPSAADYGYAFGLSAAEHLGLTLFGFAAVVCAAGVLFAAWVRHVRNYGRSCPTEKEAESP
jgi:hypothetical protein